MSAPVGPPGVDRARSLHTRARIVYLVVLLLGVVGVIFNVVTFRNLLEARSRLSAELTPASIEAQRWIAALVDQESGVRGYALAGDPSFLRPYESGQVYAEQAEDRLRANLTAFPDLLERADEFAAAATRWEDGSARELIEQTERAGAGAATATLLEDSKTDFDAIRASLLILQGDLEEERLEARRELDERTRTVAVSMGAVAVLLGAGLLLTWLVLKRLVLAPLDRLGNDAREVAAGDLEHPIASHGPAEFTALAGDMEAMRRRILDELAVVEDARTRLQEQAADLERSNQELEQFAYVASHDLQEPLRKVTGFCQLLQRRYADQLDDRADEYIAYAVDGAKRMQLLINDLLAFSRVGRTTESFTAVDLGALATAVVGTLVGPIEASGATVEVGPLPTVEGDQPLLEALLQNLIANAVKFHGDEPPVISVTAEADADGTGWTFSCADNGIGIEPAYVDRVFVIFQRLHNRETYEGTGIGLAMCRKIVEFHGGRIWVGDRDPEDGPGTTIRWTLPTSHRPAAPAASEPIDDPTGAPAP